MEATSFFAHLWEDYISMAPKAARIKALFEERGEIVLNDHVAFRSFGLRPNHFTIAVNHLKQTPTIESVLDVVEAAGYPINESGGRVQGTPAVLLQQASTMADRMPVEFANGVVEEIPTGYHEFALPYPDAEGKPYQGFVAASADKIFESIHA